MQGNEIIDIGLMATEWNQVIAVLADGPYRIVAPLLTKIQTQINARMPPPPPAGNGAEAAHVQDR